MLEQIQESARQGAIAHSMGKKTTGKAHEEAARQTKAATSCLFALFDRTSQQIARVPACCSLKE